MRTFNHYLATSRSGKSAFFRVTVNDRDGERMITLSSVLGWRADLARRYLTFDSDEWNDTGRQNVRRTECVGRSQGKNRSNPLHRYCTVYGKHGGPFLG